MKQSFSTIANDIYPLVDRCTRNTSIDRELYTRYAVMRGLRDLDGNGVVTGLTEISTIKSKTVKAGKSVPCRGELFYRGINVKDLVNGFAGVRRFGFEEAVYLLLFGDLPAPEELEHFIRLLCRYRLLPADFTRDVILKTPGPDVMNSMAKSVLTLASYDKNANDVSLPNVLRQSLQLISDFSLLAVYSYQAYRHYGLDRGLHIHRPAADLSIAENLLRLLRSDKSFTPLEAELLDVALVIHAEHGGGNNSTFTTHVVTSSGTDTYSSVAASLCSLKGPKHGGANLQVKRMMTDLKQHVRNWDDEGALRDYLVRVLNGKAFDGSGLIYGMGHAVYSLSDPRAEIFKSLAEQLSREKGMEEEFYLYERVARLAQEVIAEKRKIYKGVSPNVDFYSGFAYSMLKIPDELFTPIFAVARIAGWCAHRMEELINGGKIIRPAYLSVAQERPYIPLNARSVSL